MSKLYYLLPEKQLTSHILSPEKNSKVLLSLLTHVYKQTNIAMVASIFCASVLFIGLYDTNLSNVTLWLWAIYFLGITFARIVLVQLFKAEKNLASHLHYWRNLYIIGALLGGISWGLPGIFLLPQASAVQQTLMILMLAGVTAGAVPLAAAVPGAALAFLIASILPYILTIVTFKNNTYLLFDGALTLYLIYSIVLTLKTYKLIRQSIILKFENDLLLSSLELSNKKLEEAATHDPLTQVANRRLFAQNLEAALERARQQKKLMALLYVDLDHFKAINDTYGHHAGDHILVVVIERLKKYFNKADMIARLGGDELAVIIEDVIDRHHLEVIAIHICELIAKPIEMNHIALHISASVGISIYPYDGHDEEALIKSSDQSMYFAKQHGGNQFHFHTEYAE